MRNNFNSNRSHHNLLFNTNLKGSASVLVKSRDDGFSPVRDGRFSKQGETRQEGQLPTFGGGGNAGNSGENSNTTGAIN